MSWCWVVVVVVVVVVVGTHVRRARARAPNKPPNPDSFGARTYAERMFGSPQTKPKPWYLRCFCSKRRKQKLKIRIAKKQKHCILRCFWPVGCQNSRSEKCLKHRCLQCFVLPPKTKQRYVRCFPTLNTPK